MAETSPRAMLRWISRTYGMGPADLARMFQRSPWTVNAWLRLGRIPDAGRTKIRSAFWYLHNLPDPLDPPRSGITMV